MRKEFQSRKMANFQNYDLLRWQCVCTLLRRYGIVGGGWPSLIHIHFVGSFFFFFHSLTTIIKGKDEAVCVNESLGA